MSKESTSLRNLIRFCMVMHREISGEDLLDTSPSYIMEKWDKMVQIDPSTIQPIFPGYIHQWENQWLKWEQMQAQRTDILRIVNFIYSINKDGRLPRPQHIIDKLKQYTGSDKYNSPDVDHKLHPDLEHSVDRYFENYEDDIKIILRDRKIDAITQI